MRNMEALTQDVTLDLPPTLKMPEGVARGNGRKIKTAGGNQPAYNDELNVAASEKISERSLSLGLAGDPPNESRTKSPGTGVHFTRWGQSYQPKV